MAVAVGRPAVSAAAGDAGAAVPEAGAGQCHGGGALLGVHCPRTATCRAGAVGVQRRGCCAGDCSGAVPGVQCGGLRGAVPGGTAGSPGPCAGAPLPLPVPGAGGAAAQNFFAPAWGRGSLL